MLRRIHADLVWRHAVHSPCVTSNNSLDFAETQFPCVQNGDAGGKVIKALAALLGSGGFIRPLSPTSLADRKSVV